MNQLKRIESVLESSPIWLFLGLYVLVWIVAQSVSNPNLDPYGDMFENYIWGQSFSWGNFKHPPLLGWVTGFWFDVFPQTNASYLLLAYLNAAIGLAGVYVLGGLFGLTDRRFVVVMLLVLALPYATLAAKFNANSILLALWPWIAVGWLGSMNSVGTKGWLYSLLFGVCAALGLLGKYYTGVLLLSLVLITLASREGRSWVLTARPWFAIAVAGLVLTPHVLWLIETDFATFAYVKAQGSGEVDFLQLGKFLLVPFAYSLLAFSALLFVAPNWRLLWRAWIPESRTDCLFLLALLPLLISLIFGLTGFVSLSSPWAIPLVFCLPLLWLRNAGEDIEIERANRRAQNVFLGYLCCVLLLSPAYAWYQSANQERNYYLPTEEAVYQIQALWFDNYREDYEWVAGENPYAASIVFYGGIDAEVLPAIPQRPRRDGIVFCHLGVFGGEQPKSFCTQQADLWAKSRRDKVLRMEFTVSKQGPRYLHEVPHLYRAYFYRHQPGF